MPTSQHVIRLAGIWEIAPFDDVVASRIDSPCVAGRPIAGSMPSSSDKSVDWTKVRLDRLEAEGLPFPPGFCRRFFNRPTNLAPDQPVYLEWTGLRQAARIRVNGLLAVETAGAAETIRLRIDDRLAERNELHLVLRRPEGEPEVAEAGATLAWPFRDCRLVIDET